MSMSIRVQLSVMMFVQFFIWGAWFVTLGTYIGGGLGQDGGVIGKMYTTTAWGAIIAPLFIGMVADRFFYAQRVLGVLHLVGAGIIYYASTVDDPKLLFWVLVAYAMCYMPTLALVNTVAFNQIKDPGKELPPIRVVGTVGWIVAGLVIGYGFKDIAATSVPMKIAAGASVLMGIYSFFLPKTPPRAAGKKASLSDVLGLESLALMRDKNFAVFVFASVMVVIPLAAYYSFGHLYLTQMGMVTAEVKLTMGQISEVVFMLLMPFFFVRLGVKKMLLIGMLAWVARYVLWGFGDYDSLWFMLIGGILLHGICYDFFFLAGQIYVDEKAPEEMRANAQGFIAILTYGIGMLLGNFLGGAWVKYQTVDGVINWQIVWLTAAIFAFVVAIGFALFFKDSVKNSSVSAESTG
ncbi:MAG: nucleoside permease [Candidatus Hydrogenedentes bacterium]|nr:nucleoside permease [Candidatus Hydrogenedentota bacterium]